MYRFLGTNKLGWVCDELNVEGGSLSSYCIRCDQLNVGEENFLFCFFILYNSCWIPHRCIAHSRSGVLKDDCFTTSHAMACLSFAATCG